MAGDVALLSSARCMHSTSHVLRIFNHEMRFNCYSSVDKNKYILREMLKNLYYFYHFYLAHG